MRIALQINDDAEFLSVMQLQNFTPKELREHLKLKSDAVAQQLYDNCRGNCSLQVLPVSPPKRLGDLQTDFSICLITPGSEADFAPFRCHVMGR